MFSYNTSHAMLGKVVKFGGRGEGRPFQSEAGVFALGLRFEHFKNLFLEKEKKVPFENTPLEVVKPRLDHFYVHCAHRAP